MIVKVRKQILIGCGLLFVFAATFTFTFVVSSNVYAFECPVPFPKQYSCCTRPNGLQGLRQTDDGICSCTGGIAGENPCGCPLVCPPGS